MFDAWQDRGGNRFSHEWTADWGVADDPTGGYITDYDAHSRFPADRPNLVLRREMVFLDGQRMRQVVPVAACGPGTATTGST